MKIRIHNTFSTPGCHATRWLALALAFGIGCAGAALAQPAPPTVAVSVSAAPPASAVAPSPAATLPGKSIVLPAGDSAATGNPYGLQSVWERGDAVSRLTISLLVMMSLLSWYIIIAKLLEQRRLDQQSRLAKKALAGPEPLAKRFEVLPKASAFRFMVESAFAAARRHASLAGQVDMNSWLSQDIVSAVTALTMRSQEGLSVLATVGSTAPFVGLFGTVWGIYNALITIGTSGQASIDKVAGPVGEALIMTALGLAVAVPAVLGYNWLVRRNRVTLHTVRGFGSELHTQLLVEIDKRQRATAMAAT